VYKSDQQSKLQHNTLQSDQPATNGCTLADRTLARGTAAVVVIAGLAMIATPASARWYKWVDEDGNISYQDQPPPSSFEESSQVLNENGVTLKTIPSKQEQDELDRQAAVIAEKRQRDEALLKAFPTEYDLTTTRDQRVLHVDGTIARMHDQLVILNSRLVSIEDRINVRIDRNLSPSDALESDRIAVMRSIDSTNALIKSKLRERRLVMAQFDRDLVRYRELISGTASTASIDE